MKYNMISLGEVAEVKNGYAFKSKDFKLEGIPVVKIKNITPPNVSINDVEYVSNEVYNQTKQFEINYNDILISMTGSGANQMSSAVGKVGRVRYKRKSLQNQRVGKIIVKDENIYNSDFLYYYLNQVKVLKHFVFSSTGSANQANISTKLIKDLLIPNISLENQKRISSILSSFDNKIENNNAIISNLEAQAQAIFKSWFIDFEPFQDGNFVDSELGEIPEGWEVRYLIDLIDFQGGSQPPKTEHIYEKKEGYIRFIQNRDYSGQDNHITYIKEDKKNKTCDRYDILMDKYGEAGKIRYGLYGAYNVALAKIKPYKCNHREYIRAFLSQESIQKYIYNSSIASTRPSVSKQTISNIMIIMPSEDILRQFSELTHNIINYCLTIKDQNQTLAKLRDTLLPKLMSGELRIGEEDIEDIESNL